MRLCCNSLVLFFVVCCFYNTQAQYVGLFRTHFFHGLAKEVFKPAIGPGISYCFDSYDLDQFEFSGIVGISYSFIQPQQDTFLTQVFVNDTLITGSWERYSNIHLFCFDLDFVWALSDGEHVKPFGGFTVIVPYFEYNYRHVVPGVIDYSGTNEFYAGIVLGPVIGTWIYLNETVGFMLRAKGTWGFVFTDSQAGFLLRSSDISAGLMINFE